MNYKNQSILETIKGINEVYYLPSIQRKFVWELEQIEHLFDSIMCGYPIGTFLFWLVEKGEDPSHIDDYTFYQFISDYKEDEDIEFNQKKLNKPSTKDKIIAVLDGQQRLSSLYCALKGSYAYKTSKKDSPNNQYPQRELYINLLYHKDNEQSNRFEFKFKLSTDASLRDENHYWLKVKDVISWASSKAGERIVKKKTRAIVEEIKEYFDSNEKKISNDALDEIGICVEDLWRKLVDDELITYYEVSHSDLSEVLDIFVRLNSQGTPLSRSDLVFSTIVAHWEDGREKIESLIEIINDKGDKFKFDKDFIISLCLALMDFPQKFDVKIFSRENVKKVEEQWENITSAICDTVDLIVEFGFNGTNLTAQYIVIPIAYYFFKSKKTLKKLSAKDRKNIKLFLISGMLKKIFSGGVDSVLKVILDGLKQTNPITNEVGLKHSDYFDYELISTLKIQDKTIKITYSDLDSILDLKKGALTFMALSLLYPNIRYKEVKWHQDHIHPKILFDKNNLKKYYKSIGQEKENSVLDDLRKKADTLCNLQLLEGQSNQSKNKALFIDWINSQYKTKEDIKKYCEDNYIDEEVSFELSAFDDFYLARREKIKNKLISIFNITDEDIANETAQVSDTTIKETIIDAICQVLADHPEGLNPKEIYEAIIKDKLYEFKAVNPVSVLTIELRRHCVGVEMSAPAVLKIFKIVQTTDKGTYYALVGNKEE